MFGVSDHYYYESDRPLHDCGAMIDAMIAGKDEAGRRALGASISPHMLVADSQLWRDGHTRRSISTLMDFACAATIHGDLPLIEGLMSRKDFFETPPLREMRDKTKHPESSLPMACAYEAASRGRDDILGALRKAAQAWMEQAPKDDSGYGHRPAREALAIDPRHAESLVRHACASRRNDKAALARVVAWAEAGKHSQYPFDMAACVMDEGCEHGHGPAIELALSMKAKPEPTHVVEAASHGALDMAARMAKIAKPARKGSFRPYGQRRRDFEGTSVAEAMADRFRHSLSSIAEGSMKPPAAPGEGREVTWAQFSDHREAIHVAALRVLRGDFDMASDDADKREAAKNGVASFVRAMCALGAPEDARRLAEIESARPGAAPTCEEMTLLANLGSPLLASALDGADKEQGSALLRVLAKAFDEAREREALIAKRAASAPPAGSPPANQRTERLRMALFEISQREGSILTKDSKQSLAQLLFRWGLREEFERITLDQASAPATKRGRTLKV